MRAQNSLVSHIINLTNAALRDVSITYEDYFNITDCSNTCKQVERRVSMEGVSFLTKALPSLGKMLDKCLALEETMNAERLRFSSMPNSKLPRFLGEFFRRIFDSEGKLLPNPCTVSVSVLRQILYMFYKYELPYTSEQEQKVLDKFARTEQDLLQSDIRLDFIRQMLDQSISDSKRRFSYCLDDRLVHIAREARIALNRLFSSFNPRDIYPRHGPGAVATRQQPWSKFVWTNVSSKITDYYPLDEYFYASKGHFCDSLNDLNRLGERTLPARVLLVPKDSRGPRLISCEPVDFQWVQQGLGKAIVEHVESNPLTRYSIHFTDQGPNGRGALLGSSTGRYATLDLNEASDRVSLELVRLLFPPHICEALEAARSDETVLPSGEVLKLRKFAPMGSSLCFPIMALTIWALLYAGAPDRETRESLLVYGDDVIVTTAYAGDAMSILESFGLKINRDKSCTKGSFRESCGIDAFQGSNVTPVRIRTVWDASPSPEVYSSWIAYANSFYDKKYFTTYDCIVRDLIRIYGKIPDKSMNITSCPCLREVPDHARPDQVRTNRDLQRREYRVWTVSPVSEVHRIPGWSQLLRYFTEKSDSRSSSGNTQDDLLSSRSERVDRLVSYTRRKQVKLKRCWLPSQTF